MDERELAEQGVSIHTGFPNAAVGSSARGLDIGRLIIKHPSSTFFMRLEGNEWNELGMFSDDIVVIDKSLDPRKTDTVAWWDHDRFVMSKLTHLPKGIEPWGVITSVIHQLRR